MVELFASKAGLAMKNASRCDEGAQSAAELARLLETARQARLESERLNEVKDNFLATLAHELRTPLSSVLGWADLLLANTSMTPEVRRGLEAIARGANAQAKLIDDLLDINGIGLGKIRLEMRPFDLSTVVETVLDSVYPSIAAKAITLHCALDRTVGLVRGDRHRVQQVVWNLLTNAVKFTRQCGEIDVLLARRNVHVEITVRDTGIGIRPDFLPHVFERFRQGDSTRAGKYRGLGLGLYVVKQLVELHGGTVEVESPGVGKGATFTVRLPADAEGAPGSCTDPVSGVHPIREPIARKN
jgi:signal transduction histidine kinase